MSHEEHLPANAAKLDNALRSIGYSLESAVADVIDNSIDAKATKVFVRLLCRKDGYLDLLIADNGLGMDAPTLREAMRFGSDMSDELGRLGKFGLGLKLASLSQARELHVLTLKNGTLSGRAWLEHAIAQEFKSTVYDPSECKKLLSRAFPDQPLSGSGTVVWWSRLYRVRRQQAGPEDHAQKLLWRIENFLSLTFHRFLAGKPRTVSISLDIRDESSLSPAIPINLDPLDPFDYGLSGHADFPLKLATAGSYSDKLKITAHIWPPNSNAPQYKLPGGANSRQGFYFYRNNRLIQAGGWNGLRQTEPHSSLARIEVDVDASLDIELSLDVKKVEIQLAPDMATSIEQAKSTTGIDFERYLSIAKNSYTKRQFTQAELPLIPVRGLPSEFAKFLRQELRIESTAKYRGLQISWKRLGAKEFFAIDRDEPHLYINSTFRKQLQHGIRSSSADIPVVKCLLFFALEDALISERTGSKLRNRLEQLNKILVEAVKYERSAE